MAGAASRGNEAVAAFMADTAISQLDEDGFPENAHPLPGDSKFLDAGQMADRARKRRR